MSTRDLWRRAKRLRDPREVRRLLTLRCDHCGHKFRWINDSRHSYGNRDGKVYHASCIGYQIWRSNADERLAMLDLICEVWEVVPRTAKGVAEMRAASDDDRVAKSNAAFRVFYDLEKLRGGYEEADRG